MKNYKFLSSDKINDFCEKINTRELFGHNYLHKLGFKPLITFMLRLYLIKREAISKWVPSR